jgi:TolB-like protein
MQQRKLAAIMFSDIVGYTSLMGSDERKAFDFIKKNRRIHWRLIRKYKGRLLKEMGDGILASFSSSMDAIKCALSIQLAAKELDIPLRIGIHQGDVIFEKQDVLGDGVNIASRIQGIADTHGIVISEAVFRDIKNKDGLDITPMGEQVLKGVESPIGAYKISSNDTSFLQYAIDTGELIRPLGYGRTPIIIGILFIALVSYLAIFVVPGIVNPPTETDKSILVLPFDNYIGSDTLDYFVAGMHSALIGDIGKISSLQVKSKTTANAYKGVEKSIPEIAKELGVNVIIEGSVLCLGDSVCLQIKVVSAYPEEQTLWVQDYYEEKSQILQLYNTITKEISNKIDVILTPQEESLLTNARTVDPEAYDAYLKGQYYWEQLSPESMMKAMKYFQTAIDIDPYWGAPYAGMGMIWGVLDGFEFVPRDSARANQARYLQKAFELDPNSANTHYIKAINATWGQWDWETAEKEYQMTLELNPNDALCHIYYAHYLMTMHRLELDPLRPLVLGLYGVVMNYIGKYNVAIKHAEKAISLDPENMFAIATLQNAYRYTENYEKWFENWEKMSNWEEEEIETIKIVFLEKGYTDAIKAIIERNEAVFKKGGLTSLISQAENYLIIENYDRALDYFEMAYQLRMGLLSYISLFPRQYPALRENERFIALLGKMDLPVN